MHKDDYTYISISNQSIIDINSEIEKVDTDKILFATYAPIYDSEVQQLRYTMQKNEKHGFVFGASYSGVLGVLNDDYDIVTNVQSVPVLVKTNIFKNYGLLDESANSFEEAITKFSIKMNSFGLSSVQTKFDRIEREWDITFSDELLAFTRQNRWFDTLSKQFNAQIYERNTSKNRKPTILIDLWECLPPMYNGTTKLVMGLLPTILEKASNYDVTLLCHSKESVDFFKLDHFGERIIYIDEIHKNTYDLLFSPSSLNILNETTLACLQARKIVVLYLDTIGVRTFEILINAPEMYVSRSLSFDTFEKVISISNSAQNDAVDMFYLQNNTDNLLPIPLGYVGDVFAGSNSDISANNAIESIVKSNEKYIFMYGNWYSHKSVPQTLDALKKAGNKIPIVVLSSEDKFDAENSVYHIKSGNISDKDLSLIQENASLYLYPSVYEGFGFPIAEAAKQSIPIIAYNSEVTREVSALYPTMQVQLFDTFDEIPGIIEELLDDLSTNQTNKDKHSDTFGHIRTLDDAANEVWDCLEKELQTPIGYHKLKARQKYLRNLRIVIDRYSSAVPASLSGKTIVKQYFKRKLSALLDKLHLKGLALRIMHSLRK